ncbi:MAG: hypothetical protein QM786_19720 [Breznakibacter sp.]
MVHPETIYLNQLADSAAYLVGSTDSGMLSMDIYTTLVLNTDGNKILLLIPISPKNVKNSVSPDNNN